jgi:hypothetical protein
MRAIDSSNWLKTPMLEEIKAEDAKSTQSNFRLKATLGKQNVDATKVDATK